MTGDDLDASETEAQGCIHSLTLGRPELAQVDFGPDILSNLQ